jgi:hypothetical protein
LTTSHESENLLQMKILPAIAALSLVACATSPKDQYVDEERSQMRMSNCELLWVLFLMWWDDT